MHLMNEMLISIDYFTSMPTFDGVSATFAMGFGFESDTFNAGFGVGDDI